MLPPESQLTFIEAAELSAALTSDNKPIVIDVRTFDPFEAQHIPGSMNVCVYAVSFLSDMEAAVPDKDTSLVVYGERGEFKAAQLAAGRLAAAGYTQVSVVSGGLNAWLAAGLVTDGIGSAGNNGVPAGEFAVDASQSKIRWIGRNLLNQHDGQAPVKAGSISVDSDGNLQGGELVVDMTGLTCGDIDDPKLNQVLIQHLMHEDFFKTDDFPEARFSIEAVRPIPGCIPGRPNVEVDGEMTIRGVQLKITLQATYTRSDNGYVFQAQFDFDRTAFGSLYGSGKFFEALGLHLVNDLVYIQVVAVFPISH